MPDVSHSSKLLLNTLSIRVEDCSVNLVGNVIFGKNPTVIYKKIDLIALPYGQIMQILVRIK